MSDLLRRLQNALPKVEQWVRHLRHTRLPASRAVDELRFARLARCLPAELLASTRVQVTDDLPFPPVSAYGIPEFEAMATMPMAGITFDDMYFVRPGDSTEAIHFHELIHVIQWRALGVRDFLLTYAVGFARNGYQQNSLEQIAFELQHRFETGGPFADIPDIVIRHASHARDKAAAAFRAAGQGWGA